MEQFTDFLKPTMSQVRKSIKGIDDSYNNFWDILAELIQNAVDAINTIKGERQGIINIIIDSQMKEIMVTDNGCGIDPEKLPILLRPFSTDKESDPNQIGEKGVGLKFAYFQSTDFQIHTGTASGSSFATIKNARLWKESTDENGLVLEIEKSNDAFVGTEVVLKGIDNDQLFQLTIPQMKYVLRTKTAAGNTRGIWEETDNVTIVFSMTDCNGNHEQCVLPYKYWLPTEGLSSNDMIDLDTFSAWIKAADRSDFEKREKLKDKVIISKGQYNHNGYRAIRYWTCFMPTRATWDHLTIKQNLATEDLLSNDEWLSQNSFITYRSGIYTAVKGMPTGISIEHPATGYSGYWANIFMIFEDDMLSFDIGRKAINYKIANIYRAKAKDLFNDTVKVVSKYISGSVDPAETDWNKEALLEEIKALPDLGVDQSIVKFTKNPKDQEASVAAIFYELIGSGRISDVMPLISGYRNKYDLYAKWNNRTVIIEFKSHLRNLVKDFDDARKLFDEIDYVVCWEVTDDDKESLHNLSISLDELMRSSLSTTTPRYISSCTHQMMISAATSPVYVIDLKKLLS